MSVQPRSNFMTTEKCMGDLFNSSDESLEATYNTLSAEEKAAFEKFKETFDRVVIKEQYDQLPAYVKKNLFDLLTLHFQSDIDKLTNQISDFTALINAHFVYIKGLNELKSDCSPRELYTHTFLSKRIIIQEGYTVSSQTKEVKEDLSSHEKFLSENEHVFKRAALYQKDEDGQTLVKAFDERKAYFESLKKLDAIFQKTVDMTKEEDLKDHERFSSINRTPQFMIIASPESKEKFFSLLKEERDLTTQKVQTLSKIVQTLSEIRVQKQLSLNHLPDRADFYSKIQSKRQPLFE